MALAQREGQIWTARLCWPASSRGSWKNRFCVAGWTGWSRGRRIVSDQVIQGREMLCTKPFAQVCHLGQSESTVACAIDQVVWPQPIHGASLSGHLNDYRHLVARSVRQRTLVNSGGLVM